jgi:iron complex transport system substrate-binding protein
MKDRTTVMITILIVLIAGIGVYAESFLNNSNKPGSDIPAFREVVLDDPQGTGNNSTNGTGNITGNTTQTGTSGGTGTGIRPAGTSGGTRTGTGPGGTPGGTGTVPAETKNDTSNVPTVRIITDMLGRNVTVPAQINKVLTTSPLSTDLIYMIAPDKLAGWNFKQTAWFMEQKYKNLPVIGRWSGTQTGSYEECIRINPDIVFDGSRLLDDDANKTINERQAKFGQIPVVAILDVANATRFKAPIAFMGQVLGAQRKADELIAFYERVLNRVTDTASKIPENERVTVYYARGSNGLQTGARGSEHAQLIDIAGGKNVVDLPVPIRGGPITVSMEQVLGWNPEIILVGDPTFYKTIYTNPTWQNVKAVQDKKVYLVPQDPRNWFDMPPGPNVIMGIPWTAKTLYPERFKDIDMKRLTKEFYSKFYHYDLTDDEVNSLLNP